MNKGVLFLSALAIAAAGPLSGATAADVSFEGKTLKIIIPYGPGGTYDKYGQTFTEYLGRHLPGHPTIILQHMPGAGGVKAMNWAYNVAPKDGTNLITPIDNSVINQLMRPDRMRYDTRHFNWIGTSNQTTLVMAVRSDSGVTTIADMKTTPVVASSSGQDTSYIGSNLAAGLLGLKIKVVSGYKGSSAAMFAIEQGESHMAMYNWLAWGSKVPHWFQGEKPFAHAVLQIGMNKDPDVPESVPLLSELVTDPKDKAAVTFVASLGVLGRGLALPPGVSADIIATQRAAYDKMNADPEFAAVLKKRSLRLIPSSGAEIQKHVIAALDGATPDVVARAKTLIYGK